MTLSDSERALINELRTRQASADADRLAAEAVPDILSMDTAAILGLSPEKRSEAMRVYFQIAQRGD